VQATYPPPCSYTQTATGNEKEFRRANSPSRFILLLPSTHNISWCSAQNISSQRLKLLEAEP
jgi:hypothetical protein